MINTEEWNAYTDHIQERNRYWNALKEVRDEFYAKWDSDDPVKTHDWKRIYSEFSSEGWKVYIEEVYGIKLRFIDGRIASGYDVVDEQKHLIFTLKFL